MKILVVTPDSKMGGITSAAVNFCNELFQRGNDVYFLDLSLEYFCKDKLNQGIHIGNLIGRSRYWNLGKSSIKNGNFLKKIGFCVLGFFKKITIKSGLWYKIVFKKYKQFFDFDVAVAFRQCASCYSFVLNKVQAKKKIGFVHGDVQYMGDISSWKKYMTCFNKIAYVSNAVKEGFIQRYPELKANAQTIYNMLNSDAIIRNAKEECDIKFNRNKINIVTISRIEDELKGIDRIAPICKRLKEKGIYNFEWYIVGGGADYPFYLKQSEELCISDCLHFLGKKENPFPYLVQADFMVSPSKTESFGLVVVESLILHKPVIACEYPALQELLDDGELGVVVKQDIELLFEAIYIMLTDCVKRNKLKINCMEYEYSNDKAYQQFLEAVK